MTTVCLQGGNELTDECRPMDTALLERAGDGPVVVLPLASKPGSDFSRTSANARAYFSSLGADVLMPPDPRRGDAETAHRFVADAAMIVLTGGSPRLLRDSLVETGLAEAVRSKAAQGALVMGSSAGAMVACATTLLPRWRGNPDVGPGIGLVPDCVVVPHFDGQRTAWVRAALAVGDVRVLGIPECSGVLIENGEMTAVGLAASAVITADGRSELAPK